MDYSERCENQFKIAETLKTLGKEQYHGDTESFILDIMVVLGAWSEALIDDLNDLDED